MDEMATDNQEQEKKFTLRTSDDIYDQFSLIAKERGHSVNTLINIAMREYIINKKGVDARKVRAVLNQIKNTKKSVQNSLDVLEKYCNALDITKELWLHYFRTKQKPTWWAFLFLV